MDHITSSTEQQAMMKSTAMLDNFSGTSRAGLFRTPISGGVQSATLAHRLPDPAVAVRNLMEQVFLQYFKGNSHPYFGDA